MVPNMGTRLPKMGTRRRQAPLQTSLAEALFTSTQQRVLGLIFGQPERSFTLAELFVLARAGRGAVQRELRRLVESGLVAQAELDGRKRYRANADAPIYEELRALVGKLFGIEKIVRAALEPLRDRIELALLYGSIAKGTAGAQSDIDVLIVADDVTLEDVFAALESAEQELARKINPTLYTKDDFARRQREHHPFVTRVLAGKNQVLFEARADSAAR
jgi:predicted nucleotidyltransferase